MRSLRLAHRPRGVPVSIDDQIQAFVGARRPDLVRFAALQLRDSALAEDVVQETLMAAMQGAAEFGNRSSSSAASA